MVVTGANGFVGARVIEDLSAAGWSVRAVVRSTPARPAPPGAAWWALGDLSQIQSPEAWSGVLSGADAVIHLAGRAHMMQEDAADPLVEYRRANVGVSVMLAQAAANARVKRFVFMSSVKAVGETSPLEGLAEDHPAQPEDAYGISKREAELELLKPGRFETMDVIVLRPPLVYGPGVRANFARLVGWVSRGVPLPFGGVRNRRSLVYLGNLVNAVRFSLTADGLAGKACFVTDGDDVSTPDLVARIATAMGKRPRLVAVPPSWLRLALALIGKQREADRLLGSLVLRMHHLTSAGWHPVATMAQGLRETVHTFDQ